MRRIAPGLKKFYYESMDDQRHFASEGRSLLQILKDFKNEFLSMRCRHREEIKRLRKAVDQDKLKETLDKIKKS